MNQDVVVKKKRRFWPQKLRWKIALISLLILLFLIPASLIYGNFYLKKGLPTIEGEITLPQLQQSVTVYRDVHGVPHIEASNLHDLYIAQGYITAQDRLFQMDLSRRVASGMLSEIMGESLLDTDRFFRTIGLRRAAEASYEIYSKEAVNALHWYAEGVNQYIEDAKHSGSLPVEFSLVGYEPKKWTPVDSLTIGKYMAYDLGGHWEGQAFRHFVINNFPEEKAIELFPAYPDDGETIIQALKKSDIDIAKIFASAVIPNQYNGSNNWVVSGEKTMSGKPLLANDPHLGLGTPAIWYETHLQSEELNVSGVTFSGIPGIVVGHNDYIAWGVTNVGPDVQDLFIEKRHPDKPYHFKYNDKWEKATVIQDEIKVKDSKAVPIEIIITRHGPLFSEFALHKNRDTALALQWTSHRPSTELEAILRFNKAKNWDEFEEALTYFHTPAQNFVFAAKDGTIAYKANGLIPIRKNGDGQLPVPGWIDQYEWQGFIPWDELPRTINPKQGFIATANNKVVSDEYPYHITHTWATPYRQQRIVDVLSSKNNLEVKDMMSLQNDIYNMKAKDLLPYLLKQLEKNSRSLNKNEKVALQLLKEWNYMDDKNLPQPLIFNIWFDQYIDYLFEDRFPKEVYKLFEGEDQILADLIKEANQGNESTWMKDKGGFTKVTMESFSQTIDKITEMQGDDPSDWSWGKFHTVSFEHPLSQKWPLHLFFNATSPVPLSGGDTVGRAGWNPDTGKVDHGAPWRTIVDVSDLSKSWNVIGPGQSGHLFSEWYNDQVDTWTSGKYHITYTKPEKYTDSDYTLVLKPSK